MSKKVKAVLLLLFLTVSLAAVEVPLATAAHYEVMTRVFGIKGAEATILGGIFAAECIIIGVVLTPLSGAVCGTVSWA